MGVSLSLVVFARLSSSAHPHALAPDPSHERDTEESASDQTGLTHVARARAHTKKGTPICVVLPARPC